MRNGRPNTILIGIAGVHHVVSELSRRGLVALPTTRNIAGYDVVVATIFADRGERYLDTIYCDSWVEDVFGPAVLDPEPVAAQAA